MAARDVDRSDNLATGLYGAVFPFLADDIAGNEHITLFYRLPGLHLGNAFQRGNGNDDPILFGDDVARLAGGKQFGRGYGGDNLQL